MSANRLGDDAVRVASGLAAYCTIDMGSCQSGSHSGSVYLRDGVPWATCRGRMPWQCYDGPAADCAVGYGFGEWARELARLVSAGDPLGELRLERARLEARIAEIDALLRAPRDG